MERYRHPQTPVDSPAAGNAEVTIYQDSDGTSAATHSSPGGGYTAVSFGLYLSQAVTVYHKWGPDAMTTDANLQVLNGSGSGETVNANTFFSKEFKLHPGRNKITVKAGATPPTATVIPRDFYAGPALFVRTTAA